MLNYGENHILIIFINVLNLLESFIQPTTTMLSHDE